MSKQPFTIGEYLKAGDVSTVGTDREQIEYIPLDLIDPDPDNFYSLDGINELAANIETVGLQQPLRVRSGEGKRVTVVSGHRRRAACLLIRDGGSPMFDKGVPCIREIGDVSRELQELRLIFANSATRVLTASEMSRQAERIQELLIKLSKQGFEFKGRMRDQVAAALNSSKSRIGRLHAIREHLVPELLAKFDGGELGETVAYRISQEDPTLQRKLMNASGPLLETLTAEKTDVFLNTLKNMGKASPEENKPDEEEQNNKKSLDEAYISDSDNFFRMLIPHSMDLLKEIDRRLPNGGTRNEGISVIRERNRYSYSSAYKKRAEFEGSPKGLTLKKPKAKAIFRSWNEVYDMLCSIAIQLAVTAPSPEAAPATGTAASQKQEISMKYLGWLTGTPPDRVKCWAKFMDEETSRDFSMMATYDAEMDAWWSGANIGKYSTIDQTCIGWWPLPEDNAPDIPGDLTPQASANPISESSAAPTWHTGRPEKDGTYWCEFQEGNTCKSKRMLAKWHDGEWYFHKIKATIGSSALRWYPLPEEDEE